MDKGTCKKVEAGMHLTCAGVWWDPLLPGMHRDSSPQTTRFWGKPWWWSWGVLASQAVRIIGY